MRQTAACYGKKSWADVLIRKNSRGDAFRSQRFKAAPQLLRFSVRLPSVTATARWRESGGGWPGGTGAEPDDREAGSISWSRARISGSQSITFCGTCLT